MIGFLGIPEALLLICLGIGYIVIYLAKREERQLQLVGYIIGSLIIGLSLIYQTANLWVQAKMCSSRMPYQKAMMMHHPMSQQPLPQASPTPIK